MVGYERFDQAALPGHFGPGLLSPNHLFFTGAPRAGFHSLAIILTLELVSK